MQLISIKCIHYIIRNKSYLYYLNLNYMLTIITLQCIIFLQYEPLHGFLLQSLMSKSHSTNKYSSIVPLIQYLKRYR